MAKNTKPTKQTTDYIRCCPRCGNPGLDWVGGGEDAVFDAIGRTSLSGMMYCTRCQKEVPPIEFDSEEHYLRFVKKLRGIGMPEAKPKGKKK